MSPTSVVKAALVKTILVHCQTINGQMTLLVVYSRFY